MANRMAERGIRKIQDTFLHLPRQQSIQVHSRFHRINWGETVILTIHFEYVKINIACSYERIIWKGTYKKSFSLLQIPKGGFDFYFKLIAYLLVTIRLTDHPLARRTLHPHVEQIALLYLTRFPVLLLASQDLFKASPWLGLLIWGTGIELKECKPGRKSSKDIQARFLSPCHFTISSTIFLFFLCLFQKTTFCFWHSVLLWTWATLYVLNMHSAMNCFRNFSKAI